MGASYSHETLISTNKDANGDSYYAKFETKYFGKGAFRWAFKGTLCGKGPRSGEACVAKVFHGKRATYFDVWKPDLAVVEKADKFARHFNRIVLQIEPSAPTISYQLPLVAKLDFNGGFYFLGFIGSGDQTYVKPQEYVAIEPFLRGTWKKFNSNGGYEDEMASRLLPAFTHWTFEQSGHKFMVCDLQGILHGNEYILTDPVVHSSEGLYSGTRADLGIVGMERVLQAHKCNFVCHALGLTRNPVPYSVGIKRTSYDFDLTYEEKQRNIKKYSPYFRVPRR